MSWYFKTRVDYWKGKKINDTHLKVISDEVDKLFKQRCQYCSGFAHSTNDCPTDHKLRTLRLGPSSVAKVIKDIRKTCKANDKLDGLGGWSKLTASHNIGKRKVNQRDFSGDLTAEEDNGYLKQRQRLY